MSLNEEKAVDTSCAGKEDSVKKPLWKRGRFVSPLAILLLFLLAGAALIFKDKLGSYEQYGYAGTFLISIAAGGTIIVPIPALAVVFTLGGLLNPVFIGLAAGLGEAIGGLIDYMAGYGGHSALAKRAEKIHNRVQDWIKRRGSLFFLLSSSVLNPFFTFISATAGAVRFPMWKFFLATWAGKTIKGLSVAYLGHLGLGFIFQRLGISV